MAYRYEGIGRSLSTENSPDCPQHYTQPAPALPRQRLLPVALKSARQISVSIAPANSAVSFHPPPRPRRDGALSRGTDFSSTLVDDEFTAVDANDISRNPLRFRI